MTNPEIEKLAREYSGRLYNMNSDYYDRIEVAFNAGYLKGVEIERKRCLEIYETGFEKNLVVQDVIDLINSGEQIERR